jgi:hypothetical protein
MMLVVNDVLKMLEHHFYWQVKHVKSLPRVDLEDPRLEEGVPDYPDPDPFELMGRVNAA